MELQRELAFRQGDVLIFTRKDLGSENGEGHVKAPVTEADELVFATGTNTGHRHRIVGFTKFGGVAYQDGEAVLVRLTEPNVIIHEEHGPIPLEPGDYEVRIQKQFVPGGIANVMD